MKRLLSSLLLGASFLSFAACQDGKAPFIPAWDVYKQIPAGEYGLFKLRPDQYPDMSAALADRAGLQRAIEKSIQYMEAKSSLAFFPPDGVPSDRITHAQVYAGLLRFDELLKSNATTAEIQSEIRAKFEVWSSKGYDWDTRPKDQPGKVWYTAYFTPIYDGSRTRTDEFQYPIYKRPGDLESDPTGMIISQRMPDQSLKPGYPTRSQLMANDAAFLKGKELFWFKKPMEAYLVEVQGSAQIRIAGEPPVYVGYNGSNGGQYRGLGTQLREAGILAPREVNLPNVIKYFDEHPADLAKYTANSDRFVFFKEYTQAEIAQWPSGSIGRQVTPTRSLATDKTIFPRAAITFIDVPMPNATGQFVPSQRLLCDQDTGGGIQAAGRADIYVGIGPEAGRIAGMQLSEGTLFYLVMPPQDAPETIARLGKKPAKAAPKTPAAPKAKTPSVTGVAPRPGSENIFPK